MSINPVNSGLAIARSAPQAVVVPPNVSTSNSSTSNPTSTVAGFNKSSQSIEAFVKTIESVMKQSNNAISMEYDKSINMIKILIKDKDTNVLIRTIPTQEFIDMKIQLQKTIGVFLNITV